MRNAARGLAIGLCLICAAATNARADEQVPDADNTKHNVNDRGNLTAQDSSNQKSEVQQTAQLRRAILKQKGLSVDAQNIKIIDENGCVVLRGPVSTVQEKQIINDLATRCCGANYKNELEVKTQK